MEQELKKEILTRDKFSRDFVKIRAIGLIFENLFAFGLIWFGFWLISLMLKFPPLHIISGIALIVLYVWFLIDFIAKYIRLKKGNCFVLKDELIGTSHRSLLERLFDYYMWGMLFLFFKASYNLNFKCYGWYIIPNGENYSWSKMHNMMGKSVYNSSNVGDEFYIVSFDKKKIALVYNTKFFEFKD